MKLITYLQVEVFSSSLTPSVKQVDLDAKSGADAIGSFTATALTLNGGGVFDWQIKDFTGGASGAGSEYDVLNFDTTYFRSRTNFYDKCYGNK